TLLLGNLLLLLGWDVTHEGRGSIWRWAALGLVAGIGWWTNGLIIAYVMPVGVLIGVDMWRSYRRSRAARKDNQKRPDRQSGAVDGALSFPQDNEAQTERAHSGAPLQMYIVLIGIAAVAFLIGSAPWWAFNFQNDWAALHFYLPSNAPSQFA